MDAVFEKERLWYYIFLLQPPLMQWHGDQCKQQNQRSQSFVLLFGIKHRFAGKSV